MADILHKKFEAVLYDMFDSQQWEHLDDLTQNAIEWVNDWRAHVIEQAEEARRESRS